ncbi:hypothetical protein ACSQ67_016596 [Phaseolus vulgaris]
MDFVPFHDGNIHAVLDSFLSCSEAFSRKRVRRPPWLCQCIGLEFKRIPYYGIEACNDVLNGYSHIIGSTLKHECLCTRVALLIKRKWKNDAHMDKRMLCC